MHDSETLFSCSSLISGLLNFESLFIALYPSFTLAISLVFSFVLFLSMDVLFYFKLFSAFINMLDKVAEWSEQLPWISESVGSSLPETFILCRD